MTKKKIEKIAEGWICMDLMVLYEKLKDTDGMAYTKYGYEIIHEDAPGGSDYYDLVKVGGGVYRCCDGEQCLVQKIDADRIRLVSIAVDSEGDADEFYFELSDEEFNIAARRSVICTS